MTVARSYLIEVDMVLTTDFKAKYIDLHARNSERSIDVALCTGCATIRRLVVSPLRSSRVTFKHHLYRPGNISKTYLHTTCHSEARKDLTQILTLKNRLSSAGRALNPPNRPHQQTTHTQ